ncbi:MAG: hypothetical protein ACJ72Z_03080 [Pyrinomonadaceae bacterium]
MRRNYIFAAVAIFLCAFESYAQNVGISITPSGDKEIIVVKFPAPADRNFVIFEAVLPVRTVEECMASRDFANAIPATNSVGVYDPATATWYLRNSNSAGTAESCTVILMRSSADTNDVTMKRARYGTQGQFADVAAEKLETAKDSRPQRSMVTSVTVTFGSVAN